MSQCETSVLFSRPEVPKFFDPRPTFQVAIRYRDISVQSYLTDPDCGNQPHNIFSCGNITTEQEIMDLPLFLAHARTRNHGSPSLSHTRTHQSA